MAMVNLLNGKDSRWLQLEVCREFQRQKCSRPDTECKFAHPPANVEVQNGRVTACYDSIKGRCNREKPPCKYFHPPQHLKDQLLINGRNHLALKNALMQQMGLTPGQPLVPGQVQAVVEPQQTDSTTPFTFLPYLSMTLDEQYALMAANPYLTGMPQVGSTYSPYFAPGPIMPTIMQDPTGVGSPLGVIPQTVVTQQKMPRSDRLEMDMKSVGSFYYDNFAFPAGVVPYKRPAADKSGVPVYQPNAATTYQQLMQLQQPFVPVSCEYPASPAPPPSSTASPTVPEAAASAQTASVAALTAANYMQQTQQPPPQTQQTAQLVAVKETEQQVAMSSAVTSTSMGTNSLPAQQQQQPLTVFHDPAAIAKEVAQQNYAKAVKLAAMTATSMAQLNPLNYTGVALNKQALSMPQPALRYPSGALPLTFGAHLGGLANHYSAAIAQQNFLNMARAPAATLSLNPYSFMRPVTTPAYGGVVTTAASPLFNGGLLATAQYPPAAVAPSAAAVAPAAAVQNNNNNNNVVVQPYKKLKTS